MPRSFEQRQPTTPMTTPMTEAFAQLQAATDSEKNKDYDAALAGYKTVCMSLQSLQATETNPVTKAQMVMKWQQVSKRTAALETWLTEQMSTSAPSPTSAPALQVNSWRLFWLKTKHTFGAKTSSSSALESAKLDLDASYKFSTKTLKEANSYLARLEKAEKTETSGEETVTSGEKSAQNEQLRSYSSDVMVPIEKWLVEYRHVQSKYKETLEAHLVYDYYTEKLASLREQFPKVIQTREVQERLDRNVTKQQQAQVLFVNSSAVVIPAMQEVHGKRFDMQLQSSASQSQKSHAQLQRELGAAMRG